MTQLAFHLFGLPTITLDGAPVHIERRRALALAIYLAVTDRPHGRDALLAIFWPDYDTQRARTDLRRTLYVINHALGGEWLVTEADLVQFRHNGDLWLDTRAFRALVAGCAAHGHPREAHCPACLSQLEEAVALYRDEFLAGFALPDSPDFDDWQFFEGEALRNLLADALEQLVRGHVAVGHYARAITFARRWLTLDPLNESVHRWLMQLYTWHNQPTAALRQYDQCVQLLAEELDVPPEEETAAIYQRIKNRQLPPPVVDEHVPQASSLATPGFPPVAPSTIDELRVVTILSLGLVTEASDTADSALESLADAGQQLFNLAESAGTRYGGELQRLYGADLLLLFGAAQAHEDDAERALQVALLIRQAAQAAKLSVAMGITTGMAYVKRLTTQTDGRFTVIGPAVQLAPRLRNRSGSHEIYVDGNTYRAVRGLIHGRVVRMTLPGSRDPLTAYAIEGRRSRAVKARGIEGLQAALVGRADELNMLRTAFLQATHRQAQVMAIVGPAGIGKSRLVAELKGWVERRYSIVYNSAEKADAPHTVLWLEGRGLEYATAISYGLIADLLRGYWQAAPDEAQQSIAARLQTTLRRCQDAGQLDATQVGEISPLLAHLLSLQWGNEGGQALPQVDPSQLHLRTLAAIRTLLVALAQHQPLVLLLEDLQWADALSLEVAADLLTLPAETPILLLYLYRPEGTQRDARLATLARQHSAERFNEIPLRELTPPQSSALLASLLTVEALPPHVHDLILREAQGNPLFLEEVIRSLIDSGQLYQVAERWQAKAVIEALTVPETLQRLVLSRVDQLPAHSRSLLQQAAVLGRLFLPTVLAAMNTTATALAPLLQELTARSFIYLERALPEPEYSFHHVLVRDAIYQALPHEQRARLHHQAADALAVRYAADLLPHVETLAYHYWAGDDQRQALPYLLQAGEKARRSYANAAAADYFQRALSLLATQPISSATQGQRLAALTGLGQLFTVTSEFAQAEGYLRQAILLGEAMNAPMTIRARLHAWLGDLLINYGSRPAEALALTQAGLALLGDDVESVEAAMLYGVLGWCYQLLGDEAHFKVIGFRAAQFVERLPPCEEFRPLYGLIHIVYLWEKALDISRAWCIKATAAARQLGDLRWLGEANGTLAYMGMVTGEHPAQFLPYLEEGRHVLNQINERRRANWFAVEQELYLLLYGMADGAAQLSVAIAEARLVNQEHVGDMLGWLGILYLIHGDHAAARATTNEMRQEHELHDYSPADALVALGYVELAAGEPRAALMAFESALYAMGTPEFAIIPRNFEFRLRSFFVNALSGLERAFDDPAAYRAFCDRFRAEHQATLQETALTHWCLEPTAPRSTDGWLQSTAVFANVKGSALPADWQWIDPPGGAKWLGQDGLIIHVPNIRDLWYWYLTAPRVVQCIEGDWVVQATCQVAYPDRPAIGGLLLWQDKWNYLRLDWGERGPASVALQGCIGKREVVIGCGQLRTESIDLRLERSGSQVRALCGDSRGHWYLVGQVDFPTDAPVQVGLFAASNIDRFMYPGRFPDGTAICFRDVRQWQPPLP